MFGETNRVFNKGARSSSTPSDLLFLLLPTIGSPRSYNFFLLLLLLLLLLTYDNVRVCTRTNSSTEAAAAAAKVCFRVSYFIDCNCHSSFHHRSPSRPMCYAVLCCSTVPRCMDTLTQYNSGLALSSRLVSFLHHFSLNASSPLCS